MSAFMCPLSPFLLPVVRHEHQQLSFNSPTHLLPPHLFPSESTLTNPHCPPVHRTQWHWPFPAPHFINYNHVLLQ
jgi:hypothetical protein